MWRVSVENFRELSGALVRDEVSQFRKPICSLIESLGRAPVHFHVSLQKWPHEPRPDRALMVDAVAASRVAAIAATILRIRRRQTAQSKRRQQMLSLIHISEPTRQA